MLLFSKAIAALFTVAVFAWLAFSAALALYDRGNEAGYKIGQTDGYREGAKVGMQMGIHLGQQMRQQPTPRNNET